jgi:hypothetical protein
LTQRCSSLPRSAHSTQGASGAGTGVLARAGSLRTPGGAAWLIDAAQSVASHRHKPSAMRRAAVEARGSAREQNVEARGSAREQN